MKITAYGVRPEEKLWLQQLAESAGFELVQTSAWLTADNVALAQGSCGISAFQTLPYDQAIFAQMAALQIPVLAIRNVGTDNIDLASAAHYGIQISNVPSYSPAAIAEFVVLSALELLRRVPAMTKLVAQDKLAAVQILVGRELNQQTVGVVGTGHIGLLAAKTFHNFGAKVIAFDAFPRADKPDWLSYTADLPTLLKQSQIVTLHVPGIKANDHLLNADTLKLLPQGAVVINTARGNLIDTAALYAALQSDQIGGAAIDTYEFEAQIERASEQQQPITAPYYHELAALDNVLLTPHIAYHTDVAVQNMVQGSVANILNYQSHQQLLNPVK
ncbi:NAD(P)-dependent oxidoreductase [Lapidilactobacillus wuchangensis]|uniref:NAD(P)-dependent oxidoreductase n=1 Tax=Lapidilactobacillus wuchangensis TaxID=2486001 RepID=UPI000F76EE28|nr:NAD(P)-dependent oxidoreductase [Lapidilactobacillus wuchangensis]